MWLLFAFLSAACLGFYDVFKKLSLRGNAVMPVLFLNTLICSLLMLPPLLLSLSGHIGAGSFFWIPASSWEEQKYIVLKALLVLSSWALGYYAIKHLPLTITGPVNATRPVLVLIGAMIIYGERLNYLEWIGVLLAVISFFLLSRSGKKEGISFAHNRWIFCLVAAAVLGAMSGLYDKYLLSPAAAGGRGINRMVVQAWFNFYQCALMFVIVGVDFFVAGRRQRHIETALAPVSPSKSEVDAGIAPVSPSKSDVNAGIAPVSSSPASFHWRISIPLISVFLTAADLLYFYALSLNGAMISVVSLARRGSVVVSFLFGALILREKNLKAKAIDILLVLLGMLFLYLGSRA